jgi:type III secretion protein Q
MDRTETMSMEAAPSGVGRPEEDLNPPFMSSRSVALANRLSVRRCPVAFNIGDVVLSFHPAGLQSIETGDDDLIGIGLRLDGRPAVLRLPAGLFERILERVEPELLAADLDDEFLPLLLEASVSDALNVAESKFQGRIELRTIERNPQVEDDGLDILFEIAMDGDFVGKASLHLDESGANRLANVLGESQRMRSPYRDLKAELSFRGGVMWLSLGELRSLKAGDVLLPDEDPAQANEIAATLGETWLLNAEFQQAGLTLTKPLRPASQKDRDLWMMVDIKTTPDGNEELPEHQDDRPDDRHADGAHSNGAENPNPSPEPSEQSDLSSAHQEQDTGFDDVPIKLVFELGRLEINLGRLQELGAGHVFELDRPLGEAVEVLAGGRRIGQGEVVKIDNQVGVRMVRLFGHG